MTRNYDFFRGWIDGYDEGFNYGVSAVDPDTTHPAGYAYPARDLRTADQARGSAPLPSAGAPGSTACSPSSDREPDTADRRSDRGPSPSGDGSDQRARADAFVMHAGMLMAYRAAAEELTDAGEFIAAELLNRRARDLVARTTP